MNSNDEKMVKKILDEGIKAVRSKNTDEAVKKFKQITVMFPDSDLADNALYNLGMVYEMNKDYSRAFIEYKTILEFYPKSDAAVFAKDKIESLNQNLDPGAPDFAKAQKFYIEKKYDEAIKTFSAIINDYPNSTLIDNAIFYMGMIKKIRNDAAGAKAAFDEILTKYPDSDAASLVPEILSQL